MKKRILILFYALMAYLGVIQLFYWINRKRKLVLTYHNVIPDELFDHSEHLGVSHSESVFDAHLKLIRKRFVLCKKDNSACLITFDDGYKNQIEIASKILDRYHLKGIFFVSFQPLITRCTLIIDRISMWISYVPIGDYDFLDMKMTITDKNRQWVLTQIYDKLISNYDLWDIIENELENAFPFQDLPINEKLSRLRFEPLEPQDLADLAKHGHTIGAHSWNHLPLGSLPIDKQQDDFSISMNYAKQYCNSLLYSYPFGGTAEVTAQTANLCEAAGFTAAYMNISESPGWAGINKEFILPRLSLPNDNNKFLIDAKLSGFESFCKKIFKKRNKSLVLSYGVPT